MGQEFGLCQVTPIGTPVTCDTGHPVAPWSYVSYQDSEMFGLLRGRRWCHIATAVTGQSRDSHHVTTVTVQCPVSCDVRQYVHVTVTMSNGGDNQADQLEQQDKELEKKDDA